MFSRTTFDQIVNSTVEMTAVVTEKDGGTLIHIIVVPRDNKDNKVICAVESEDQINAGRWKRSINITPAA